MGIANRRFRIGKNENCEAPSHIAAVHAEYCQPLDKNGEVDLAGDMTLVNIRCEAVRRKGDKWYGHTTLETSDPIEFWNWIRDRSRPREPLYLYSYDWHVVCQLIGFWQELDSKRFSLTLPVRQFIDADGNPKEIPEWRGMLAIDDRPFIIYAVGYKGTVKLIDIRNYIDVSIMDFANSCGKGSNCDTDLRLCDTSLQTGLERTTDVILTWMERLISKWRNSDHGNIQPTAARLAWGNFRHGGNCPCDIIIDNPKMNRQFQRDAYYGGETQCWYTGYIDGPIYKDDVNGLYPACMLYGNFPCDIDQISTYGTPEGRSEPRNPYHCTASVVVQSDGNIPTRDFKGKTVYPVGNIQTTLCGDELGTAWESGRILDWYAWTSYKMAPLFERYVTYWWAIRKQCKAMGDRCGDQLAKIMLNSLYGKFAARRPNWEIRSDLHATERWGYFPLSIGPNGSLKPCRAIAGIVQEHVGSEEREDTFPAISAFVASAARVRMRAVRSKLPVRSVIAQQNDCFLLTEEGHDSIRCSNWWGESELGKFGCRDIYWWLEIYGGNQYLNSENIVASGLTANNKRVESTVWQTYHPAKSSEMLSKGPSKCVTVKERQYQMSLDLTGRKYGPDGWAWQ